MSYILTLLVLVPLVGSVAVWVAGITQRTAKWIALGFSLVETGLTTLLLVGFIEPSWAFAFGAPTFTRLKRSEEHTSELQSHSDLVCRLLLEKKKNKYHTS